MAKSAVLKKVDMKQVKKAAPKGKAAKSKKPVLKVVKTSAKPAKGKNVKATVKKPVKAVKKPTAKKAVVKAVKKAAPKAVLVKKAPMKVMSKKATAMKVTSAPAPKMAKTAPAKPAVAKSPAARPVLTQKEPLKQPVVKSAAKCDFRVGDHVVYPTHGVGKILAEETQVIGEVHLRMLVIVFEKDRMTLRVPVTRAAAAGLRHISGNEQMTKVFVTLKGKAKVSRGMWSRRAQEYEAKINSGNILFIAEVVRDLHHNVDQAERSYSERMIYESALGRLVGELAAAESVDQKTATDKLMKLLRAKVV